MPAFNATRFAPLAPWNGFKLCETLFDCILNNGTIHDVAMACVKIIGAPDPNGRYCRCDLELGGMLCNEFTSVTILKVAHFAFTGVVAFLVSIFCIFEVVKRGCPKKLTPIVASLWLGSTGCAFGSLWSVMGVLLILDPDNPNFQRRRQYYLRVIIPYATATPLASVLIITLAWRQVLVKSSIIQHRRGRSFFNISISDTTHKTVVFFAIFVLYVGGGVLISLGQRTFSGALACLVFGISGVYLVKNAKKFTQALSGIIRMESERSIAGSSIAGTRQGRRDEEAMKIQYALVAARAASREVAASMFLVFFFSLGYAVANSVVGVPAESHRIAVPGYLVAVIAAGNSLTALAAVKYARNARLISERKYGSKRIVPINASGIQSANSSSF